MRSLTVILVLSFYLSASSQVAPTYTTVTDTLHYYFNKYHFKTAHTLQNFPYYKSPAATNTALTHCGSFFENFDTLIITGLEAFVADHPKGNNVPPVHLYLCDASSNKMPIMPPIDSVVTSAGSPQFIKVGGPLIHGPVTLLGNFFVLYRNMSGLAGDTVRLLRTAGKTYSSVSASSEKNSDGYGVIRYKGNFYSTTNFNTVAGFGHGTDYEFCIAPRVKYNLRAAQILPDEVTRQDTVCTFTPLIFRNNSSKRYVHRQYNLNEFYYKWKPFLANPQVPGGWSGDGSVLWKFEPEDAPDGRVFLGPEGGPQPGTNGQPNVITFATDSVNPLNSCFTSNQFRARLRPMSIYGRVGQYVYNEDFTLCTKYCNGTALGISSGTMNDRIKVYPHPVVYGVISFKGIDSEVSVKLFNITGQLVLTSIITNSIQHLNVSHLNRGIYLMLLSDSHKQATKRIVIE